MSFKAGSIVAEAKVDQSKWHSGISSLKKSAKVGALAIGAVFVTGMTMAVKAADEFQKEMANVSTLIDETKVSTQDLTKQLFALDPALGDTTELTKALYQSFSAGAADANEAMQTTIDSAKFAKAGLTDTATAVDVLTTAVNAYGRENVSTTEASDIFFTTIKEGKITGEQLASSIGNSIPLFSSAKIELEELGSGMAAMTKQGVSANVATTQLNAIVTSFLTPNEALAEQMKELGFATGSAFLESEGLTGALELLEDATAGDATELAKLLPNIRAMKGAMALTGVGGEEFTEILGKMETATGATDIAFAKQEKTFDTLKNQLNAGLIVVGNMGKILVDQVAVGATKAAGGMIAFLTSARGMEVVSNLAGFVSGGFEAIKTAVQPLIDVIGPSLKTLWETVTEAFGDLSDAQGEGAGASMVLAKAGKGLAIAFTVVTSVVGLAIKTIVDLVMVIKESGSLIGNFFEALIGQRPWSDVGEQAERTGQAIANLATGVVTGVGDIIADTTEKFRTFNEDTQELAEDIEISYTTAFKNTSDNIQNNWGSILTGQDDFNVDLLAMNDELMNGLLNNEIELAESEETLLEDSVETWRNAWDEKFSIADTWFSATEQLFTTGFDVLTTIQDTKLQNQLNDLEGELKAQQDSLQDNFDNGLISQKEFDDEKEKLQNSSKDAINSVLKEQFENEQDAKRGSAVINAASSIMGWWGQAPALGPIAGPIFAGAMTALTTGAMLAQLGAIDAQQFTPRRTGGPASGLTRMHEDGGELTILPDGSFVIPHDLSENMMGGQNQINVSFEGAIIKDTMDLNKIVDAVANKIGRQLRLVT